MMEGNSANNGERNLYRAKKKKTEIRATPVFPE
jgi:hypothetical protein